MKKTIFLFLTVLSTTLSAQIKFDKGDWASVRAKAKENNQIIMIDFYTVWCGPCRVMDRDVFSAKQVGDFYNKNFVNYKIDAEKGEGVALAQKYAVQAFPTFVFTDADGKFLHQAVGGMEIEDFINVGKDALDPEKRYANQLEEVGDIDKSEMPALLRKLKNDRVPYQDKFEKYITSLSQKELLSKETFDLMKDVGGWKPEGFAYETVLKNRKGYSKTVGEQAVNRFFYRKFLSKSYGFENKEELQKEVLDVVNDLGFDFADKIEETLVLTNLLHKENKYNEFVVQAPLYLDKFEKADPTIKYSPVFVEGMKFVHKTPELKAYVLKIADELIAANDNRTMVYSYLGKIEMDANQLQNGLKYYEKALQSAKDNKEEDAVAQLEKSILFIKDRIKVVEEGVYTINGKDLDDYNGMTIGFSYPSTKNIGEYEKTEYVVIKDGTFSITGKLDTPTPAMYGIMDGENTISKGSIILEPGTYSMKIDEVGSPVIEEGVYNYYVLNAWRTWKGYKDAIKELKAFTDNPDINLKDTLTRNKIRELMAKPNDIKEDYLVNTYADSPDPMVKLLITFEGLLFYNKNADDTSGSERMAYFEKEMPNHFLVKTMRHYLKQYEESMAMQATVGIGKTIKDFTAKDHQDKVFNLSDVLKKNKYVLVEFWASWCGPCRGEIPHMKTAYSHFKNKGFEIVSFSLDHKKDKWDKAYKDDGIPWIDTSDLLARKSPVVKMYGVTGVPANFLVDENGTIVATDLRQDQLDEKLEELFGM